MFIYSIDMIKYAYQHLAWRKTKGAVHHFRNTKWGWLSAIQPTDHGASKPAPVFSAPVQRLERCDNSLAFQRRSDTEKMRQNENWWASLLLNRVASWNYDWSNDLLLLSPFSTWMNRSREDRYCPEPAAYLENSWRHAFLSNKINARSTSRNSVVALYFVFGAYYAGIFSSEQVLAKRSWSVFVRNTRKSYALCIQKMFALPKKVQIQDQASTYEIN